VIALIALTVAGRASAARLAEAWPSETRTYDGPTRQALHRAWAECDGLVCFLAVGATTRLVAPLLDSKWVDPAVVCVDEAGRYAVALVGGHVAGANALCTSVAGVLGAWAGPLRARSPGSAAPCWTGNRSASKRTPRGRCPRSPSPSAGRACAGSS